MMEIHATCVVVDGRGVLLRGPSGSGKSDLALRLIDGGAGLVADDRVQLENKNGGLQASAPNNLFGLIEVRGLGIARLPALPLTKVVLAVDLVPADAVDRLPDPAWVDFEGARLPLVRLNAFETSTPAKVRLAVLATTEDIIIPP